ncbi:MAG: transposase [Candidatus Microthrix sp.]|nr:transposase [Candidatus Microthrix sp.]
MTTPDSALNALSASLTAVDSPLAASLAEIVADAIQELIEAELSALIGAEPNERSMSRTNLCNGHRDKLVSTPAGDITVGIPETPQRVGGFYRSLPARASAQRSSAD